MNAKVVSMQNIMSGTQITFLISCSASILTIYNFNQTGSNSDENEIPNTMLLKTFAQYLYYDSYERNIRLNTQRVLNHVQPFNNFY